LEKRQNATKTRLLTVIELTVQIWNAKKKCGKRVNQTLLISQRSGTFQTNSYRFQLVDKSFFLVTQEFVFASMRAPSKPVYNH
jgi:hypothetical protein